MCKECLREPFPERQRTTLDTGSYTLNYAGCAQCGERTDFLETKNRHQTEEEHSMDDDDDHEHYEDMTPQYEETVEYDHVCRSCKHLVAKHWYEFKVVQRGDVQEFMMSCALCGKGQDLSYSVPVQGRVEQQRVAAVTVQESTRMDVGAFAGMISRQLVITSQASKEEEEGDDW